MIYEISFIEPKAHWNWVSVSSINKDIFLDFIDYLYNLDREIEVLPYIPGGLVAAMIPKPYMDKTYLVKGIVEKIKAKEQKEELFEVFCHIKSADNQAKIFFIEDVYEMLLSFGLTQEQAAKVSIEQPFGERIKDHIPSNVNSHQLELFIKQFDDSWYFPYGSRWIFIYMFRGEFIRYMKNKGYDTSVDGGWILNEKEREMKLGLIDENGDMIK